VEEWPVLGSAPFGATAAVGAGAGRSHTSGRRRSGGDTPALPPTPQPYRGITDLTLATLGLPAAASLAAGGGGGGGGSRPMSPLAHGAIGGSKVRVGSGGGGDGEGGGRAVTDSGGRLGGGEPAEATGGVARRSRRLGGGGGGRQTTGSSVDAGMRLPDA